MARRSRLRIQRGNLQIHPEVRTEKLTAERIQERPEIHRRGPRGEPVERVAYDKETGEVLEEGYGFRWVTEEGREVPRDEVMHVEIVDGEAREVEPYTPTMGRSRTVEPVLWVDLDDVDTYLTRETYEMWGETQEDEEQLYELAYYIEAYDEAPVVPFVLRESLYESWAIITPVFHKEDETFSLVLRVTQERIRPRHHMEPRRTRRVEEMAEEAPRARQVAPFA